MDIKHYLTILFLSLPFAFSCLQQVETVPESKAVVAFGSEEIAVPATASDLTVAVNANCDWTASTEDSWIQVAPPTGTKATKSITLSVAENTIEETPRSGQVTLTGNGVAATLRVNQAAPAGPVPPGTELYTAEDFMTFLQLAQDFTPADVTIVFNDIDMGGATIPSVATYSGILEGQNHKIYNFKVASDSETAGLFLTNNGVIKDLIFGSADGTKYDGVSQIAAVGGKGGSSIGLVAVNTGTIENVTNFATIKFVAASVAGKVGIGGIVGTAGAGEKGASILKNCTNKASILASGTLSQDTSVGGVVGYVAASGTSMVSCTNDADISIGIPVKKVLMIGGVLGRTDNGGTFDKLVNNGEVSYIQEDAPSTWMSIAGVVGTIYKGGVLTNSTNNGAVSSNLQQVNRIGGILGVLNTGGKIEGCTNNAPVTLNQAQPNGNWQAAGGILGFQEKSAAELDNIVAGNTNKGDISVSIENTTTHANKVSAGGVIGAGCRELKVMDNTNLGDVTVVNRAAGAVYAGGIYGGLYKFPTVISTSGNVNAGKISASTSDNAAAYAGGVAGYIAGAGGGDANKATITLTNEKNTGDIVCANAATAGSIAGFNGNGKLVDSQVGGTVNGVAVTAANIAALIQGSSSTGTYENPTALSGGVVEGNGIKNADDLRAFLTASDYSPWSEEGVVRVLADIDASSIESLQIANIAAGVVIDGLGHKIYNIKSVSHETTTGIILVNDGTVKNLYFGTKDGLKYDGVSVIRAAEGKGGDQTGLVAVNNGTLENITTFAAVEFVAGPSSVSEVGVGCLVGETRANSVIKNCVNKAELRVSGVATKQMDFGGLVGFATGDGAQVIDCSNEAPVKITAKVAKVFHFGGLVGRTNGLVSVENCHNKADVTYEQSENPSTWMSIGGVVGSVYVGGSILNSDNTGAIYSNAQQVVRMGGINGVLNTGGTVAGCVNEGSLTLSQTANGNWQSVGGIVGFQEKSKAEKDNVISNNTNKGSITVSVENTTTHANKVGVGGIIGEGCLALSVTNNTNTAPVKVTNAAAGAVWVGGIYGALIKNKQEIECSGNTNSGSVTASTSDNAAAAAGGVVGYIAGSSGGEANTVVLTLKNEKSTGSVTCGNAEATGAIAGNNAGGALDSCIAGGSVNGTAVTEANLGTLVQGSVSKGTVSGTTLAQ